MDNVIIAGKQCESCLYGSIDDANKARIVVNCSLKNRKYTWGQCVPCNDRKNKE